MEPLPIACSLDATDQSSRRRDWQGLMEEALVETAPIPTGVLMTFSATGRARTTIERLIALEQDCCAWIDWTLRDTGAALALEATAETEEGVKVLRAWFDPHPSSRATPRG